MSVPSPKSKSAQADRASSPASWACIAVGVLVVFGALNSYQGAKGYSAQFPDAYGVAAAESRFAPLIARIPPGGELGYITDLNPSQPAYSAAFLAAQYAVAPRLLTLLDGRPAPEWAAGNFSKPQDYAAAGAPLGYGVTADLGNGVVLFHRK